MKSSLILLFTLLISAVSSLSQVNLKNGLVACYPFSTNANDMSGNNNDGTVNGATLTADRFGKANSAYNFDGNSYISIAPDQFKNTNYSYSLWVNLDALPVETDNNSFFSVGGPGADQNLSVLYKYFSETNTGFNSGGYNVGNPVVSNNLTGSLPNTGRWYHLVSTRDNNTVKLYVDGVLIANNSGNSSTNGTDAAYSNPAYAVIGSRVGQNGYFQFTKGSIDDVHIYNRVINADEVKALFDGNTPQAITISSNNSAPCGGDNIIFTANGTTNTAKYQWKVDGVNQGTNSKIFEYVSSNNIVDYQVKITIEITDDNDVCFPNKVTFADLNVTIKSCNPCILACHPFNILKTK